MELEQEAQELVALLAAQKQTLVLAESCTGGMIAATLATVPGVSAWFAGSLVVYQEASKMRWLGVAEETLQQHTAVSAPVAHQMVGGALRMTPQADLAASVTGHLGPGAPEPLDGQLFLGVGKRGQPPRTWGEQLTAKNRIGRQREASSLVIQTLIRVLSRK
jgi:PncC family amidohydrolase